MIFGEGQDLAFWQTAARAAVVFLIALVLVRISGAAVFWAAQPLRRMYDRVGGRHIEPSRGRGQCVLAHGLCCGCHLVMHRLMGQASVRWPKFEALISGHELHLVRNGKAETDQMRKALITDNDLKEAIRKKTGAEGVAAIKGAVLERNGDITVIDKERK